MIWLFAIGYVYTFFVLYLAYVAMWVAHKNGKLAAAPIYVRAVVYSMLIIAVLVDVFFNVLAGSFIFWQLPGRDILTFTARCASWRATDTWRGRIARWVCDGWLNPFQEHHC